MNTTRRRIAASAATAGRAGGRMRPLAIDLYCGYVATCIVTNKRYVGVTSRSVSKRWVEHVHGSRRHAQRSAFLDAIAKYGPNNFTIETVCCARSWADICAVELLLIAQHGTLAPNGYNLTLGGDGRFGYRPSPESVEQSAAKHRGKPCHPNTRAAAVRTHTGRVNSAEHRARISAARTGKPRTEATKAKLRAYWSARRSLGDFKTDRAYAHRAK